MHMVREEDAAAAAAAGLWSTSTGVAGGRSSGIDATAEGNDLGNNTIMAVVYFLDAHAQDVIDFVRDYHLKLITVMCMIVGVLLLLQLAVKTCRFVVTQYFRRPHNLLERYGADSWAVVSGSSGGIGLGFAVELAKRGFHIVLIARSEARLMAAEAEVRAANPNVHVKRIVADFAACHNAAFWDTHIEPHLVGLDISILVNNVGINHTESFATISESFLQDIVAINCTAQMLFTRRLIRRLLERTGWRDAASHHAVGNNGGGTTAAAAAAPAASSSLAPPPETRPQRQRRSAIISVSSVAGQRPLLYLSPYSATKAFNDFFSRALALEFPDHLDVLSLRPGYVVSNMSKITEAGGFVLDRYECAAGCLEKLGYVTETYGDPRHAVYARSFFLIPESFLAIRRKQRLVEKNAAIAASSQQGGM